MTPIFLRHSENEWLKILRDNRSFWKHGGEPKDPHVLLTKGGHSDGFFNYSTVAQYPWFEQAIANDLIFWFRGALPNRRNLEIDWVIGPGTGAITLAARLADMVRSVWDTDCMTTFTERGSDGVIVTRVPLRQGEKVLACEDTITSGASISESIAAIEQAGGIVLPYILAVCNRSGLSEINGRQIVALIDVPMSNWTAEECQQHHLCSLGSEAIRPKKDNNWQRLTASG